MFIYIKVKWSRYRPGVAQRVGRGIAVLFHDSGTRRGWVVSSTPRPHFTPGKDPVPILQEAGWAPGPVWMGGKSRPHRDSIPDLPALSSVAIPTELPGSHHVYVENTFYSHLFANNEPDFHFSQRIIKTNTAVTIVHDCGIYVQTIKSCDLQRNMSNNGPLKIVFSMWMWDLKMALDF
jgi:hypothetical protein